MLALTAGNRIKADTTAPGNQRPTVLAAPNGVPVVNIQTPSAAGVSRNTYSQFDVGASGAILNNSRTNVQSQLGGWVQGNPWLATGSAKVILNEVNTSNTANAQPSQLKGAIEVAGPRAEVVIANPAGIQIDGAGFINASSVTLTTGTAQLNTAGGGSLDGYRVQDGSITVTGAGLDARQADYTNILARAVELNAGIWAQNLVVATGSNHIAPGAPGEAPKLTPLAASSATSSAPSFALDVSQLGGMYAGKIFMIGTEAGVGVRNSGTLGATAGDVVLQTNGWLTSSGVVQASGNTSLSASGPITHSGSINTLGQLDISTPDTVTLSGTATVGTQATVSGTQLTLSDARISAQNASLTASRGNIDATRASIATQNTLTVSAAQALRTDAATLSANQLNITAQSLSNVGGQLVQSGTGDLNIQLPGTLDNTRGQIATNSQNMNLSAQSLNNTSGQLGTAGSMTVQTAGGMDNTQGKLSANAVNLSIATLDNTQGQITSNGKLTVQATSTSTNSTTGNSITNTGILYAVGDQTLNAKGNISNTGIIAAKGHTHVQANSLSSTTTSVLAAGLDTQGQLVTGTTAGAADLSVTTPQALTAQGQNLVTGTVSFSGASVDLSASKTQGANITVTAGHITTAHATVNTPGTLTLQAGPTSTPSTTSQATPSTPTGLDNTQGQLSAATLLVQVANINNAKGQIVQTGQTDLAITTGAFDNSGGTVATNAQNLRINATTLANASGTVQHAGTGQLALNVAGAVDNRQGSLSSSGSAVVNADSVNNSQGRITVVGALTTATGQGLNNTQGTLAANGALTLSATSLDNTAGTVASVGDTLSVSTSGVTRNDGGLMQSAKAFTLEASSLANKGQIASLSSLTLHGANINNQGGRIQANGNATLTVTQTLDNTSGQILSNQTADIGAATLLNNNGQLLADKQLNITGNDIRNSAGVLYAKDALTVNATHITNSQGGQIASKNTVTLVSTGLDNQSGQIQALGHVTLQATDTVNNTSGLVLSGQTTNITANTLLNSQTQNLSQGIQGRDVLIQANTLANNNGQLLADNDLRMTSSGNLNNAGGTIIAGHNLTVQDSPSTKALSITNTSGTLMAQNNTVINAASLTGDGKVLAKVGDLDVALLSDYTHTGEFNAGGNASLSTQGRLTNSATLQAGQTLTLRAQDITNSASGQIYGGTQTLMTASNTLTNRGLIDGTDTQINAATLNNIGTGRIYGDHVSIQANSLTNDTESGLSVGPAGTIAARQQLDLGVGTLDNREHALVFSAGNLVIGGALDANRHATGSASRITNSSATLEALGNVALEVNDISNTNAHFTYEDRVSHVQDNVREDIAPGHFYAIYTRTITTPYATSSDPALIRAGGNLTLHAQNTLNYASHVVAGNALSVTGAALNNQAVQAVELTHDVGTSYTLVHVPQSGICGKIKINCKRAHDEWQTAPYDTTQTRTVDVAQITAPSAPGATPTAVTGVVTTVTVQSTFAVALPPQMAINTASSTPVAQTPGINTPAGLTHLSSATNLTIRTLTPNLTFPTSSLFHPTPSPTAHYLVETDPRFANYKTWLSSDYMLSALNIDPATTQKRLGDGFYEQKLVREQVLSLTGQRFLGDFSSDEAEYQALMNAGVTWAKSSQLRPGIALSAAQVASLTSDIVWLVEQTVTVPGVDGQPSTTTRALVPQLYVVVRPGDLDGSGALLAGKSVNIKTSGDLTNTGTIAGRSVVNLAANNLNNLGGLIRGDTITAKTTLDVNNLGGTLQADSALTVAAGRDLTVQTTTAAGGNANHTISAQFVDRVAGLYVSNPGGTLVASAGRDANLVAAVLSSAGSVSVQAGRDVKLGTVQTSERVDQTTDANNYLRVGQSQEVGTQITSGGGVAGGVALKAGNDVNAKAANVQAGGALTVTATRDVHLTTGEKSQDYAQGSQRSTSGFLSSSTTTTREANSSTTAVASNLGGNTVSIHAGRDATITGSNVVSDSATAIAAANTLTITGAQNAQTTSSFSQKTESGLLSGGGFGISYGHRDLSQDAGNTTTTNAASTVGSVGGNVTLSGKNYVQTGSDVSTPGQGGPSGSGDITINAQNVSITEARESSNSQTQTKFSQSGITVAISNPVVGAVQSADQLRQSASKTSDARMQALAAASATLGAKSAVTDKDGKFDADKASSVGLSISLGQSKSQSNSTTTADTAAASTLTAGGNITINAKTVNGGALANPADSNITLQGVQIKAGDAVTLDADNRVNILAAKNTQTQSSTNSSSSASVGVAIQYGAKGTGYGFTAAASAARGSSDGTDTTFTNSHISAGNQVNITSGGDTTIKGGVVTANTVKANVGGDLKVESLQDTSVFTGKQSSAGGSVMIGAGGGGSVNIANSKASGDFASVTEQSGIKAGDGGFQVSTQGDTTLTGGAITSTQAAVDNNANTFTTSKLVTSDLQNRDNYSASGFSVGLGTSTDNKGKSTPSASLGVGSASGNQSSTTTAAISGIAGNTTARTGDASTGLVKTWDGQKMLADVNAQTQITAAFGNQASKAIGDYANKKQAELQAQGNPEEAAKWAEGGTYRAGLHAVVGGLTGGVQGALGAGMSQLAIDSIGKTIASSDLPTEVKQALIAGAGTVVGAAVGGSAGAAAAGNATVNNYLNHTDALLKADLKNKKMIGKCDAACDQQLQALDIKDQQTNKVLAACDGVVSSTCDAARQEVRTFAADYIRKDLSPLTSPTYNAERSEAESLALGTMNGKATGALQGATGAVVDGLVAVGKVLTNVFGSAFGDPQSQVNLRQGAGAAYDFVKNPDNWPQLLGVMSAADREKLAQAYERGDGTAVGAIMGAQLLNLPTGGGGMLGTVAKVDKVAVIASDAGKAANKVDGVLDAVKATDKAADTPVIQVSAGSKGNWDKAINGKLEPSVAYQLDNGHTYLTDSSGRVNAVEGKLDLNTLDRNTYQQCTTGKCGNVGDEGGHLIASSLGGAGDKINIVPQAMTLNRGDWKAMENFFRDELTAGKQVSVKIEVGYPDGGGVRPNEFKVVAKINNSYKEFTFKQ